MTGPCSSYRPVCQATVTRSEFSRPSELTALLFCVCVTNKCFPLRESWQEVADYCSGRLIYPAGSAGLETHLNIDQAPGRTAWGLGPLACARALLIGTEPSCQYHSSTRTYRLSLSVCFCVMRVYTVALLLSFYVFVFHL